MFAKNDRQNYEFIDSHPHTPSANFAWPDGTSTTSTGKKGQGNGYFVEFES